MHAFVFHQSRISEDFDAFVVDIAIAVVTNNITAIIIIIIIVIIAIVVIVLSPIDSVAL